MKSKNERGCINQYKFSKNRKKGLAMMRECSKEQPGGEDEDKSVNV